MNPNWTGGFHSPKIKIYLKKRLLIGVSCICLVFIKAIIFTDQKPVAPTTPPRPRRPHLSGTVVEQSADGAEGEHLQHSRSRSFRVPVSRHIWLLFFTPAQCELIQYSFASDLRDTHYAARTPSEAGIPARLGAPPSRRRLCRCLRRTEGRTSLHRHGSRSLISRAIDLH